VRGSNLNKKLHRLWRDLNEGISGGRELELSIQSYWTNSLSTRSIKKRTLRRSKGEGELQKGSKLQAETSPMEVSS